MVPKKHRAGKNPLSTLLLNSPRPQRLPGSWLAREVAAKNYFARVRRAKGSKGATSFLSGLKPRAA